jgi:hypothetical protein
VSPPAARGRVQKIILTCLTGTTGHCRPWAVRGSCALTPSCGGCVPQPPPTQPQPPPTKPPPTRLPGYPATRLQAGRPHLQPRQPRGSRPGRPGGSTGAEHPYQGYSDPRRCDLAADQTGRLIADASMLAAWAAARTSERLAPLVPDRTITPHAADTGQMTRRSSPIASPGTISGSRSAGPTKTRILVTNPEGEN